MPDLTPAAELRAASAKLRSAALSAQEASPTPWTPDDPMDPELRWIALMHPGMGPLLAKLLDDAARSYDAAAIAAGRVWPLPCDESEAFIRQQTPTAALAVARAVNTPTEET